MSRLIDRLRLRLASLFRGDRVDASLKGEIELHLEEQIDENVAAGMSPAEARAAALRAFGPVGLIEEECRDTRRVAFVQNLAQDLRYTLRSLVRQPMLLVAADGFHRRRGRRQHHHLQPRHRADVRDAVGAPARIELVHIRMGGGSHVSHLQWRRSRRAARSAD